MSSQDVATIEHTLSELESRIYARLGRWALAILSTTIALALGAATQWFGLLSRVDRLEVWKTERAVGIEQYQEFREQLERRLTRLEAGQDEILRLLQASSARVSR